MGRVALRYWLPLCAYCGAIFVLSSQPAGRVALELFPHADKLFHVVQYALLGALSLRALGPGLPGLLGRTEAVAAALLFCLAYGALDEVHQSYVPGREMDFLDLAADMLGAALAAVAYGRLRMDPRATI